MNNNHSVPAASPSSSHALAALAAVGVMVLAAALAFFKVDAANPDLFWHLRTGQWIVEQGAVPRVDMFSFTRAGMEWIDAQWLFQVVLYGFYRFLGAPGLTLLTALLTIGVAGFLMAAADRPVRVEIRAAVGVLLLLAINPRIQARPELLSFFYLAIMFFLLERARSRPLLLVPTVLVQFLFANSEGIWPIGVGLVWAYALDVAWATRRAGSDKLIPRLPSWLIAAAAAAAVNLVQPYGWRGFTFPFLLLTEIIDPRTAHKNIISEFAPVFSDPVLLRMALPFLPLVAVSAIAVVAAGRRRRPFLSLLALVMALLGLNSFRNIGVGGVILAGVLLIHLVELEARWPRSVSRLRRPIGFAVMAVCLFLSGLSLALPYRQWDGTLKKRGVGVQWEAFPVGSVRYLKDHGYRGGIINPDWMGGYLIWAGWPQWRVMSDSRMEIGGEDAIRYCLSVYRGMDALEVVARRHDARAAIFNRRAPYTATFDMLRADPRWELIGGNENESLFLRKTEAGGK